MIPLPPVNCGTRCSARPQQNTPAMSANTEVQPPPGKDSVKFLVVGDSGTGDRGQYDTAAQMWTAHGVSPYEFAIMLDRPDSQEAAIEVTEKELM